MTTPPNAQAKTHRRAKRERPRRPAGAQAILRYPRRRLAALVLGYWVLAAALLGPLDRLAASAFSFHMAQHIALILVAAPLLVLGRPAELALRIAPPRLSGGCLRQTLGRPGFRRLLAILCAPVVVLLALNGGMFLWHWPPFYQAALLSEPLHFLEHATFLGTALLFWGIVIAPFPRSLKASDLAVIGLCLSTALIGDLLGAALTLSPRLLYPLYALRENPLGLDPLADQALGGGLMWASSLAYFGIVFYVLARIAAPSADLPGNAAEVEPGGGVEQHEEQQPGARQGQGARRLDA